MSRQGDRSICSCGAELLWVATRNGKMQPLNAEPEPTGNVQMVEPMSFRSTPRGALRQSRVLPKAELEGMLPIEGDRFMPHHATCPDVQQYRGKASA